MDDRVFEPTGSIDGVVVAPLSRHADDRGWLMEFYRSDEAMAPHMPQMGYLSFTREGVGRGPHEHREQADAFAFTGPGVFRLALWDNRRGSPDFGKRMVIDAGGESPVSVLVPPGVVHAYACTSPGGGVVINLPDRLYRGRGRTEPVDEIRHEDDPASRFTVDFARVCET